MFQELNHETVQGYVLRYHGTYWSIQYHGGIYFGICEDVCEIAVELLGFKGDDLWLGIEMMEENFHNCAYYNSYKNFVHTYDIENKHVG